MKKTTNIYIIILILLLLSLTKTLKCEIQNTQTGDTAFIRQLLDFSEKIKKETPKKVIKYNNYSTYLASISNNHALQYEAYKSNGIVYYTMQKYKESIKASKKALEIAKKIKDRQKIATMLNNIGMVQRLIGDYQHSKANLSRSVLIYLQDGNYKSAANSLDNLGNVFYHQQQKDKALKCYMNSLKIDEILEDTTGKIASLANIGTIYRETGNYKQAINYLEKAIEIGEKANTLKKYITSLNLLAIAYSENNETEKALKTFNKTIKILKKLNDKHSLSLTYNNLGELHFKLKNYGKSMEFHSKALSIQREMDEKPAIVYSLTSLANIYEENKNLNKALNSFFEALELAEELQDIKTITKIFQHVSKIYAEKKDFTKAYKYQELAGNYKDSLYHIENEKEIAKVQNQYQNQKQKQEIYKLKKEQSILHQKKIKTRTYIIIGVILLLFLANMVLLIISARLLRRKLHFEKSSKKLNIAKANHENRL